jgi:glycine/D-amino acid oxidase-like deaminating enzyme
MIATPKMIGEVPLDYDVIITGGSFAGLAAAVQLRGKRRLLIGPHAIGAAQTSACGTFRLTYLNELQ